MSEEFQGREVLKGKDTSFGIFYPTGYIVAALGSYEAAQRGKRTLLAAGYTEDEVEAVPSDYVIAEIEKGTKEAGLLTRVKQAISDAIGTEASYWDDDLKLAKEGAGFLFIYCPTSREAERVQRMLKSENPKNMRRYARAAIEQLS
jgi:hypothetical protein